MSLVSFVRMHFLPAPSVYVFDSAACMYKLFSSVAYVRLFDASMLVFAVGVVDGGVQMLMCLTGLV